MYRYGLGEAPIEDQAPPANAHESLYQQSLAETGPSEEPGCYVFKRSMLASEKAPNLRQPIDGDSDFVLTAIYGRSTGTFTLNISDRAGKPIYSAEADSRNVMGTAQFPVPIRPALWFPAGGQISISATDTSAAPNDLEIVFQGIKRFRT